MTYAAALAHLHSLRQFGFQPGLDVPRRLAALAGDPQARLRFLHVAGTNGKGSVCALLESVHRAAGRRTGLYTSPHLVRFGERIQVDRKPIPDADLARLTGWLQERVLAAEPALQPTFFEFTTVLALCWFAERQVDLVIWETGLGGRWDATNIVLPLAAVVTNIGWDHQHILGNSLTSIATEKAGIFKPGVPAFTAAQDPEALAVLESRARELNTSLDVIGPEQVGALGYEVALAGEHQRWNAALAAAVVRSLHPVLPVTEQQLRHGLETVVWPGRLQLIRRGSQTLLLDGAHNRDGIAALRAALAGRYNGVRPAVVFGMLSDKEWQAMARELAPVAGRIVTVPVSSARTVSAEDLRTACLEVAGTRMVEAVQSVDAALRAVAGEPFVLVTGSLYLVGEVLEHLGEGVAGHAERSLNEWGGGVTGHL